MTLPPKPDFDHEKIKQAVKLMFEAIGEDTNRPGIAETPDRVARAFEEIQKAANIQMKKLLNTIKFFLITPQPELQLKKLQGQA